jgi:hypothetical protein
MTRRGQVAALKPTDVVGKFRLTAAADRMVLVSFQPGNQEPETTQDVCSVTLLPMVGCRRELLDECGSGAQTFRPCAISRPL